MPNRSTILPFCATGLLVVTVAGCAGTTPPPRLSPVDPSMPRRRAPRCAPRPTTCAACSKAACNPRPPRASPCSTTRNSSPGSRRSGCRARRSQKPRPSKTPSSPDSSASRGGTNTEFSLLANIFDVFARPARKGIAAVELERARARLSYQVLTLATEARTARPAAAGAGRTAAAAGHHRGSGHHRRRFRAAAARGGHARRYRSREPAALQWKRGST